MFSDNFSKDWDSTKNQDDFIKKYFRNRKANLTKASSVLESVDKARNIMLNSTSKVVKQDHENNCESSSHSHLWRNKRSLIYQYIRNQKKMEEKKSSHDSFRENRPEIPTLSHKMQWIESSDSESPQLKKKLKKNNKNISNELSAQMNNDQDSNIIIGNFSTHSIKNVSLCRSESDSNCLKMKKKRLRNKARTISEEKFSVHDKFRIKVVTNCDAVLDDSSMTEKKLSENNTDPSCPKLKKRKKNLENIEKFTEFDQLSDDSVKIKKRKKTSKSIKKSTELDQLSVKMATNSGAVLDDSSIREDNVSEENSDSNYPKTKKRKRNIEIIKKSAEFHQVSDDAVKMKKRKKNLESVEKSTELDQLSDDAESGSIEDSHSLSVKKNNLPHNKAYQKLQAAKFRYLNELLYTNSGRDALSYFQQNTDEFKDYHEGYQSQVSKWPMNPVDIIIQEISKIDKQAVIADLGCGEAKIAEVFPNRTVHSFDLIALKDCVTACDMTNVPLPSNSVDVVVFCLSLMGTNWKDYLKEGHRILKLGGELKVAEIESRIENLEHFIKEIESVGFSLIDQNLSHKMFVFLNFKSVKRRKKSSKAPAVTLKACLYKKR